MVKAVYQKRFSLQPNLPQQQITKLKKQFTME